MGKFALDRKELLKVALCACDQIADVWLGYVFWGVLSYFLFQLYSYSLLLTGISALSVVWAVVVLLAIPVGFPVVARFGLEFLHIIRLIAVLVNIITVVEGLHVFHTLLATVSMGCMVVALSSTLMRTHTGERRVDDPHLTRRKRFWHGISLGNALSMAVRSCNWTLDPLFDFAATAPVCGAVGALCAFYLIWREPPRVARIRPAPKPEGASAAGGVSTSVEFMIYPAAALGGSGGSSGEDDAKPRCCSGRKAAKWLSWPLASLSLSTALFLTLFFFTTPSFAPGFALAPPPSDRAEQGAALGILFAWLLGCVANVLWRRPTFGVWAIGIISLALLSFTGSVGAMFGAVLLAFVMPIALEISFRQLYRSASRLKPASLLLPWIIMFLLYLSGSGWYTGSAVPLFGPWYNHRRAVLLLMMAAIFSAQMFVQIIELLFLSGRTMREILWPRMPHKKIGLFIKSRAALGATFAGMLALIVALQAWRAGLPAPRVPAQLNITEPFSIVTYNIFQTMHIEGKPNFYGVRSAIEQSGAHVAVFQEVDSNHFFSQGRDVMPYLSHKLGMASFKGLAGKVGSLDSTILSRSQLYNTRAAVLPSASTDAMTRPLAMGTVNVNGTDILVMTFHVELVGFSRETVVQEMEYIADLTRQYTGPVIALGDYNLEPNSTEIQPMFRAGMRNAYPDVHTNETWWATYHMEHKECIDHIFYRGLTVVDAQVRSDIGGNTSDHWPVQAWFVLQ